MAVQLDYAMKPNVWRRKRIRRWIVLTLLLAGAVVVLRYWRDFTYQAKLLYVQRQCMNYIGAADRVIYDSRPENPDALPRENSPDGFVWVGKSGVGRVPPDCLIAFHPPINLFLGGGACEPAFMHERVSKDGSRKLLLIPIASLRDSGSINIIDPATAFKEPKVQSPLIGVDEGDIRTSLHRDLRVRIYAGQADPDDSSHFTIAYDVDGVKGLVDGFLTNGGTVVLAHRFGPAARQRAYP